MAIQAGDWAGLTVVCIASGPSLTSPDCEAVRASGLKSIAVNNSWTAAPFATVIYAADRRWWQKNHDTVDSPAEKWTRDPEAANVYGINRHKTPTIDNSGLRAIDLAVYFGAARVILLGYDCKLTGGKAHFHGDHKGMSNPNHNKCKMWHIQFTRLAKRLKKVEVLNCSRETALQCFPRVTLEQALG